MTFFTQLRGTCVLESKMPLAYWPGADPEMQSPWSEGRVGGAELEMDIRFERQRIYVAPRKSVLFFAWVDGEKVRCYVKQDALIGPARALREESDLFQRCLLEFDRHRRVIESTTGRLIRERRFDPDGAVTVSSSVLALEAEPALGALARSRAAERRSPPLARSRQATADRAPLGQTARRAKARR